ncbi:MAG: rRNA pseudouridine synthase [Clostridiales Family XIII bacterium]|jgi:23S rRNA pseudouridine2605 synthase|nr:rRNA pseudouridine synthase [Clostridiales Family XIII bacterium]
MRLNRYIASAGLCSRRKADALTENGNVKVNGFVMREQGYDVKEGDVVEVDGRVIRPADKRVCIVLNKPKGCITSVGDAQNRPTVMDLVGDIPERIFPVGRLDCDTAGLLILTNDGALSQMLTHPKHKIRKTYRAKVGGLLSDARIARLRKGVDIGGFVTSPAELRVLRQTERATTVEIRIIEGKNRQVRRMFAAVGCKVIELERVAVGDILLGRLKEGYYRKLTRRELAYLDEISRK